MSTVEDMFSVSHFEIFELRVRVGLIRNYQSFTVFRGGGCAIDIPLIGTRS